MSGAEVIDRDRRVHASYDEMFVVRYERAGKWFGEYDPPRGRPCRQLKLADAVELAIQLGDQGGTIFLGLPGGGSFDRGVQRRER